MTDTIVGWTIIILSLGTLATTILAIACGYGDDPASVQGVAAICPECRNGKHQNCDGQAWDEEADELTVCECGYGVCAGAST